MAIDRTRLSQPTRIALLEQFERRTDGWREEHEEKMERITSKVDVLGARMGVYAAVGASLGAGLVTGVAAALVALLH